MRELNEVNEHWVVPVEDKGELLQRKHFDKMCPGVDASPKADVMTEQWKVFLEKLCAVCTVFCREVLFSKRQVLLDVTGVRVLVWRFFLLSDPYRRRGQPATQTVARTGAEVTMFIDERTGFTIPLFTLD